MGTVLGTLHWPVPGCGTWVASSPTTLPATGSESPGIDAFQEQGLEPSPAPEGAETAGLGFVTPGAAPAEPRGCHCPLHQPGRAQREPAASFFEEKTHQFVWCVT